MPAGLARRLTGYFLLVGGVAMIFTGAWFAIADARFVLRAERVTGDVVDIVGERSARGMTLYHPVVRFRPDGNGGYVVFTAEPGLWPSPFAAGDRVTVAYDADDPDDAVIVSFWMLWFLPLATVLFGAGCIVAGRDTLRKIT